MKLTVKNNEQAVRIIQKSSELSSRKTIIACDMVESYLKGYKRGKEKGNGSDRNRANDSGS